MPVQDLHTWLQIFVIIAGAALTIVTLRNKNQINEELKELRKEIESRYVPVPVDSVRYQGVNSKLIDLEQEVKRNRDSMHDLRTQFTTLIMGKLDRIETQLTDKVRRMTNIETKLQAMEETMHEISERLHDVEKRRG